MSCRKYEAPRHGSLAYCPKKRAKQIRQPAPASPKDNPEDKPHLTSFLAYKVGMTHILRISKRRTTDKKSKEIRKEVVDAVSVLEAPEMKVYGVRCYIKGINGLVLKEQILSSTLDDIVKARMIKKFRLKKKKRSSDETVDSVQDQNECLKKIQNLNSSLPSQSVIKVLAHTQIDKLKLDCKKAHILEIQVNGGTLTDKLEYVQSIFNQHVKVEDVFTEQELICMSGVTKGKGFTGVVKRFGVRIQPRKSNKGIRKVACIGAWHPAGVLRTVARAGQMGSFKRTLVNKKIVKLGNGSESIKNDFDLTDKTINPMGGFLHYGTVKNDYIMIKGSVMGPSKRVITLGKSFTDSKKEKNLEHIDIKFIDTSSKMGHGRFQTSAEKIAYYSK